MTLSQPLSQDRKDCGRPNSQSLRYPLICKEAIRLAFGSSGTVKRSEASRIDRPASVSHFFHKLSVLMLTFHSKKLTSQHDLHTSRNTQSGPGMYSASSIHAYELNTLPLRDVQIPHVLLSRDHLCLIISQMSRSAGGKMSASKLSEALGGGPLMKLDSMQSRAGSRMDNAWQIGVVSIGLKELNKVSPCATRSFLDNTASPGLSNPHLGSDQRARRRRYWSSCCSSERMCLVFPGCTFLHVAEHASCLTRRGNAIDVEKATV
ncbi:hypothetical protein HD553DRAFT_354231 [Filobasidium floriforme]|uniref:uncharacterized protein n=1 Tax=Filobasidium floriforme TaxID=5210 RepID=UPI001E8D1B0E|nr:uncharacterized protein HD553DRAFT_354231 [Filobasidium floriforme]KAH8090658.1 hypothetical protein HD553DRAFT_354231 [Filobasidium floriforme]